MRMSGGPSSSASTPDGARGAGPGRGNWPARACSSRASHLFAGSQNLKPEAICEAQQKSAELALRLAESAPAPVRFLNLGGGFGIPYFRANHGWIWRPSTNLAALRCPVLAADRLAPSWSIRLGVTSWARPAST